MRNPMKELKLNGGKVVLRITNYRTLNVYFKSGTGNPIRRETWRGDGWDILAEIARMSHMTVSYICDNFGPSVFAEKVSFHWPKEV